MSRVNGEDLAYVKQFLRETAALVGLLLTLLEFNLFLLDCWLLIVVVIASSHLISIYRI